MEIQYLTYEDIKTRAGKVLSESSYKNKFPVAIEQIVENEFGIEVIPIRGLEKAFQIPAYISRDLKTITVDEGVMEGVLSRYRFSLAHELGHCVMHRYLLQDLGFDNTASWKTCIANIPEKTYGIMEYQANTFANTLLVPQHELDSRFLLAVKKIREHGMDMKKNADACMDSIAFELGKQMEVSQQTMFIRLSNENFQSRL